MIMDIIMWWSVVGVVLMLCIGSNKQTKNVWLFTTFIAGPATWLAMLTLYLCKRYAGCSYTFWITRR